MTYAELVQLYFERSNALQWYWTLYVVIIGGLLAFSSIRRQPDWVSTALVMVLFCFFAYKNLDAIHEASLQRYATLDAIKQHPAHSVTQLVRSDTQLPQMWPTELAQTLEPTLLPPAFPGVRRFHITSDVITVAAVWAMELRRRRALAREPRVS